MSGPCCHQTRAHGLTGWWLRQHSGGVFQLASWRWLFRFLAIIALAAALTGFLFMPKAVTAKNESEYTKFQQLDLVGVLLMVSCLLLFILGLTSG